MEVITERTCEPREEVEMQKKKLWDRWLVLYTEHKATLDLAFFATKDERSSLKKRMHEIEEEMVSMVAENGRWPTIPTTLFMNGISTCEPLDGVEMQKKKLRDRWYGLYDEFFPARYLADYAKSFPCLKSSALERLREIRNESESLVAEHGIWTTALLMEDLEVTDKTEKEKYLMQRKNTWDSMLFLDNEKIAVEHMIKTSEIESERSSALQRAQEIEKKRSELKREHTVWRL